MTGHPNDSQLYDLASIRKLLLAAFTAEELKRFCHDHPSFALVLDNLRADAGLNQIADQLITYCEKRALFDELLDEVKRANRRQYERFAPRIGVSVPTPDSETKGVVSEPQEPITQDESMSEKPHAGQLLFHDDFEMSSEWTAYAGGIVSQSSDVCHSGDHSLKKHGFEDPGGGYRRMRSRISLAFVFSGWICRPDEPTHANGDRLAVEDGNFNGYGFTVAHSFFARGPGNVRIERRDNARWQILGTPIAFDAPRGQWYQFEFHIRSGGGLELAIIDASGVELIRTGPVWDQRYSSFDRVVVHGGYPYYVDELRIRTL